MRSKFSTAGVRVGRYKILCELFCGTKFCVLRMEVLGLGLGEVALYNPSLSKKTKEIASQSIAGF